MIHIRPVSDLRNKFPEIEGIVLNDDVPVFLTKTVVQWSVLSVRQYYSYGSSRERACNCPAN